MAIGRIRHTVTIALVTCGLAATAFTNLQAQHETVFSPEGGIVTLVGCFGQAKIGNDDRYVLFAPTIGPAQDVPQAACAPKGTEQMVELKDYHFDLSLVGRWIETTGRMERAESKDVPREFHVKFLRPVPIAQPVAKAMPSLGGLTYESLPPGLPAQASVTPSKGETAVGTSGVAEPEATKQVEKKLPGTASALPFIRGDELPFARHGFRASPGWPPAKARRRVSIK